MKSKKKYIRVKDRRIGLSVNQRTQTKTIKNSNQWQNDPRHMDFAERYFTPTSDTYANVYQSAIAAGFSPSYAAKLAAHSTDNKWISEARKRLTNFKPEHIWVGYQQAYDQAPKWSDKLHALDSMGKIAGMFIERSVQQIDVQFTNAVPRPVVEVDVTDNKRNTNT